ncbi:Hemolysin-type calcium-binding repeat-containing protein [Epibacterium ulvae]|uniref:Hemolysin-type calcium-binding repeat-containing protein n=1 Tax=Epibacterium ulvae TaxID=1156985 RepID=A0A1G5QE62_9RHOB|nr:calcium-binding protein [Epibacterium ulvae]SCZ59942.1 Hemolysin-type calcium-binding repeat-containing protein [Epibacterium ulvae]
MPYKISTSTIDQSTGLTHYATLSALADQADWSGFYAKIHEYTASPDDFGNVADGAVREWFQVASQANANVGPASGLIRDYTTAQVEIRLGKPVSQVTLDEASDAIASSIWDFISDESPDNALPDLFRIADVDATQVVNVLKGRGYDVDIGVWSGNLLFAGLGNTDPFQENLLNPGDSYDLVVALQSLASVDVFTSLGAAWQSLSLGTVFGGGSATLQLADYVQQTYGTIGTSSLLFQGMSRYTEGGIQAGRQGDVEDLIAGSADDNIIHAGGGDDIIIGSAGRDFIDGGDGTDFFDLSDYSVGVYFRVPEALAQGSVAHSGHVTGGGTQGYTSTDLFSIENIRLTNGSDRVIIEDAPSFQILDAGEDGPWSGDTITFADLGTGAQIDLVSGELVIDTTTATAANFEDVFGSDFADVISGNEADNTLFGGDGADTITGGQGSDFVYGEEGDDVLSAGENGEGYSFDIVSGGAGDDTLYGNGSSYLYGNEGADIFYFYSGDHVVDASEEDTVYYENRLLIQSDTYEPDLDPPVLYGFSSSGEVIYWYDDLLPVA